MLENYLNNFIRIIQQDDAFEIYNEAGLQHELGFYLKQHLGKSYKIQLERNIEAILGTKKGFEKKEIDIYITNGIAKIAIELKVPINKQIPRRMELAFGDIRFLEQLKYEGFNECYFLFASYVKSFWKSKREQKIYDFFNDGIFQTLNKSDVPNFIQRSKTAFKKLNKIYHFEWKDLKTQDYKQWRYFILKVD
jgi:hypothetical protein